MKTRAQGIIATGWLALAAPAGAASGVMPGTAKSDPAYWRPVVEDCAVPSGETAAGLVREAVGFVGSPDPVWRDETGYGVVAACVYAERRLSADERRELVDLLSANLEQGIGRIGDDSVLSRSFSALDLSLFAALELQLPALDDSGYRRLVEDAFAYLYGERDLRGFDPRVGWIHATAHTADLFKFLARDPRFQPADQARLLESVWWRMTAADVPVFTHAEDERLAAVVLSLVRRQDFDADLLGAWFERFVQLEQDTWASAPPRPSALAASQNARNLLKSLYLLTSLPTPEPTTGQTAARDAALATLQRIRR